MREKRTNSSETENDNGLEDYDKSGQGALEGKHELEWDTRPIRLN